MPYTNSDGPDELGCDRPSSAAEVGRRLEAVVALFRSKKEAADTLEISTDQLARYTKGMVSPPLSVLIRLSAAKGVSLDWLATGEGQMRPGAAVAASVVATASPSIDADFLGRVLEAVSAVYKECGFTATLRQLGAQAAEIASDLSGPDLPTLEDKLSALKGATAQLRRQLRQAVIDPNGTDASKRQA